MVLDVKLRIVRESILGKIPGTSPLVVQYWDIYIIFNEQTSTIFEVWDGENVMFSFRRNFNPPMMEKWFEIDQIARSVSLSYDIDSLVWQLKNKGVYSASSLYDVINFIGVNPVSSFGLCIITKQ